MEDKAHWEFESNRKDQEHASEIIRYQNELQVTIQKLELGLANSSNIFSHKSRPDLDSDKPNNLERIVRSAELQNLSDKFSQLQITLNERDAQIRALVETIDALQLPASGDDADLQQRIIILQSQIKSSEIIQQTLQKSLDLFVKQYENQLVLNEALVKELEKQKQTDECKIYKKKLEIVEATKEELQKQLSVRENEIFALEAQISTLEMNLEQNNLLLSNSNAEVQRIRSWYMTNSCSLIRSSYLLELSKQTAENGREIQETDSSLMLLTSNSVLDEISKKLESKSIDTAVSEAIKNLPSRSEVLIFSTFFIECS